MEGEALGSSVVLGLLIPMGSIYPIPIRVAGIGVALRGDRIDRSRQSAYTSSIIGSNPYTVLPTP